MLLCAFRTYFAPLKTRLKPCLEVGPRNKQRTQVVLSCEAHRTCGCSNDPRKLEFAFKCRETYVKRGHLDIIDIAKSNKLVLLHYEANFRRYKVETR
jgi:hypothetical protein